jgi:hypothetical protein
LARTKARSSATVLTCMISALENGFGDREGVETEIGHETGGVG